MGPHSVSDNFTLSQTYQQAWEERLSSGCLMGRKAEGVGWLESLAVISIRERVWWQGVGLDMLWPGSGSPSAVCRDATGFSAILGCLWHVPRVTQTQK